VSGNNDYTGTNGGSYPASAGYDLATGLGTPHAGPLVQSICSAAVRISNPGPQTSTVRTPVKLQLSASNGGGSGLTYATTGLPAGLRIDRTRRGSPPA
jgi:hypothetical protein